MLVIIPVYNHFDYTQRCVESLIHSATSVFTEIMLVDDASPDGNLVDVVKTWNLDYPIFTMRFDKNAGMTRSWNTGLRHARTKNHEYAVCGNSDLIFTPGWDMELISALAHFSLVGPVSNAPGWTQPKRQSVATYINDYRVTDDQEYLDEVATRLRQQAKSPLKVPAINGFCMAAKTSTWWQHAKTAEDVFDPKLPMKGNEDELQNRWQEPKAIVPTSFVFHYRSVTRGDAFKRGLWYRRGGR